MKKHRNRNAVILCEPPMLVKKCLPENHGQHRGVHGVAIDAIRAANHGGFRRKNRCGCALRAHEKCRAPEISDHSQDEKQCAYESRDNRSGTAGSFRNHGCGTHTPTMGHQQRENTGLYRIGSRAHGCQHGTLRRNRSRHILLESKLPPWHTDGSFTHPQFRHHRPYRPWEKHPGRPSAGAHRLADGARDAGPGAGCDGPGAGARHHHQGPLGAHDVSRRRTARPTSST